ncbi:6,7-dimethyl-8-ribityllumazine synthase [Actinocatenispora comari]|uniref:6,7-dimethyl-8-ribityllumazine synthase n=1 Tax=Actinocatenispora comari TaxID=2807577 RepID=A0A8J4AF06_9ACTN|nr:6,7-dimethyl-8-ribityllumazine synthase [Actinocatenispora comari]GIL30119.1 6,7-dimethyl-8-ribityllumazine synthase [Actinocatenispora comari]
MAGHAAPDLSDALPQAAGLRLGLVAARWHEKLTDQLLARAEAAAAACGVTDVTSVRVAGSVELPVVAAALAARCDAVAAFGVVVRGETEHFAMVCRSVTDGLTRVALDTGVPVGQGVLTVHTEQQARDRAGLPGSPEDKGFDTTVAALDAALTIRALRG